MSLNDAIDSLGDQNKPSFRLRPVRTWLYVLAFMVLIMVAIGGLTRLTDSGLSITEWKPISGTIPPLSAQDWQAEFDAYKQIPEFQTQNHWMELEDFKFIFWWEWGHRFLGRLIGVAFAVPFVIFLLQKRIPARLGAPLFLLFLLGGFQGFLGWWMVSSGLTERVDVSQYRLAAHLGAASLLFWALIFVARSIREPSAQNAHRERATPMLGFVFISGLTFLQIILGAFVAGLDAGFGFNTWPLMDGQWVPAGLLKLSPWWLNFFESHLTVQFTHRMMAYFIVLVVALMGWRVATTSSSTSQRAWTGLIIALVLAQVALGIATLLLVIPLHLALGHQALAFILFGCTAAAIADSRGNRLR